ncbi:class I SAM-dependent DNA methyltransferase [Hominifimenecus sp. rT4P-3]|uniref:class I SAM-dependent DNA methyltransferase n=1 Tax=Hominifimenecus sp. rT4P-3 TaxID=3242979 RepID=UPI003DA224CB
MKRTKAKREDINLVAMRKMTALLECLSSYGYKDHELEIYLVRLLFCLFASDAGIFPEGAFYSYLEQENPEGAELSERFASLFHALDTPPQERENLPEDVCVFPYVNGPLFAEVLPVLPFDKAFFDLLTSCQTIDWRTISPAIFGAMFQEIMNQEKRREWGTYYTSEENILKLIQPLFLNALWEEFQNCRGRRKRMEAFHEKLTRLKFFDPACGCGNFLIVTYREIRKLEMAVIRELYDTSQRVLDVGYYCRVQISQFFGIEYEPFQAQIAQVGLWLTDHQMNLEAADFFGMYYARIPLIQSAAIVQGNALSMDWESVTPDKENLYIIGNPPFVGARLMNPEQKQDMRLVFSGLRTAGNMDYVTAWYRKAAEFMAGTHVRAAFVSTNSICQGEQAGLLWDCLTHDFGMEIDFAWKTFVWNNEARGQAKVHCIILGFSAANSEKKQLFDGDAVQNVPHINAYLASAPDVFLKNRRKPLSPVPSMIFGSMANDGGHLLLDAEQAALLLEAHPEAVGWLRRFYGSVEYIEDQERYCLWLKGVEPERYEAIPEIRERVEAVRRFRSVSPREATRSLAESPALFGEIRQPEEGNYILVPRVSSQNRPYIPMGFLPATAIASDAALIVPDASAVLFGVLNSAIHMAWVRGVAGRLKSDYRYSASIVYNNFPFPEMEGPASEAVAHAAEELLRIQEGRKGIDGVCLYGADTMPEEFLAAHRRLDLAVDRLYGEEFSGEQERLSYLFERYLQLSRTHTVRTV